MACMRHVLAMHPPDLLTRACMPAGVHGPYALLLELQPTRGCSPFFLDLAQRNAEVGAQASV